MNHTPNPSAPLSGPQYFFRGFSLLKLPGIRLFVILPLLVNTIILGGLSYLSLSWIGSWINKIINWLPEWLGFLSWLLWPLAVILVLAIIMYIFSSIANLIAAPFNGLLAEKLEEHLTGKEVTARETIGQAIASFPRSIGREFSKLGYYLIFALLTLIASFIISPAAPILWFCLNAWMMAVEYCDYPMDNHKLSFKEARSRIGGQRATSFSFGALVMLGTMVPILNLFVMPAAVSGGTLMWVERLKKTDPLKMGS
ncbi:sulfate transporter CysZ [Spongiibacter sp. KMU-158]|uniref:Sulfate transporter CysZ n=1 Tax=Spongiibacter pelagi TaxID=2760804 RepID=A0A927C2C7_9GAMM|nr:sulfate transporter CysZ [Spongiibacter pelagi]MBD2858757.1 sulfate transporter CysZ [Spongiibacter pelagi]